jgi:hypothetical protein
MSVDGNGTQGNLIKMHNGMDKGRIGWIMEKHSLASMKMAEQETDYSLNSKKMEQLQLINVQTIFI